MSKSHPRRGRALPPQTERGRDRRRRLTLDQLESRLLMAEDFTFDARAVLPPGADLRFGRSGDALELRDGSGLLLKSQRLVDNSGLVRILGTEAADTLSLGEALPSLAIEFDGRGGRDTLVGTSVDSLWRVDGANRGTLNEKTRFESVEVLQGAGGNRDTFEFGRGASLSGLVHGGAGGYDTLSFVEGAYQSIEYRPTSPDAGTVVLDGTNSVEFAGLEPVTSTVTIDHVRVVFSNDDDTITLARSATDPNILVLDAQFAEDFIFAKPLKSLTIAVGGGDIIIGDVDLGQASLHVSGAEDASIVGAVRGSTIDVVAIEDLVVADGASIEAKSRGA